MTRVPRSAPPRDVASGSPPACQPSSARLLFSSAHWPARLLFAATIILFVVRAVFEAQSQCDLGGFLQIGGQVLDHRLFEDTFLNSYPPVFAVAMAPLTALSRVTGFLPLRHAWGIAQLCVLAYVTLTFGRLLGLRLTLGSVALAWLCTWRYVVGDLNNLNVSLFLWGLTAAALAASARGRHGFAGALLGLGAALKIMPALAGVPLVAPGARGRLPFATGAVAAAAGALVVTVLAMGPHLAGEAWRFWLFRIVPSFGGGWLGNQSWKGLFLRLWPPQPAMPWIAGRFAVALGLGILAAVVTWVWRRPAIGVRGQTLDALLVLLAGLPALPITWFHYFTAEIPLLMALFCEWGSLPRRTRIGAGTLIAVGTVLGTMFDVDIVGRKTWQVAARYGNVLWASLAILGAGFLLRAAWQAEKTNTAAMRLEES